MMEVELRIAVDGTPPLSVLATAKAAAFSLSVRRCFHYNRTPVLVLANGVKLFGINASLRYLSRKGMGIPNLYVRDDVETGQIYNWLERVHDLFSDSNFEMGCKYVDDHLEHTFLVGDSLSVADLVVWSYLAGAGKRWENLMKSNEYQKLVHWYTMICTEYADYLNDLTPTYFEKGDSGNLILPIITQQELDHNNKETTNVSGKESHQLQVDLLTESIEGMKVVCHELTVARNPEGSLMDDLIKDADKLVSCLTAKVAKTFDFSLMGESSRSCKYVLNTLMQTFQNKRLAHAVNVRTLENLITELLLWLLDERVPNMDDGRLLLKALNVLMLKILDNAERTSSFVVLISLLKPLEPSRWPSPSSNESFATQNSKFSQLVVKCLIKLTKALENTINEINIDHILFSIHEYLQDLGIEEIRRRAKIDDKPLRMVKTVLHELVKLRGPAAINDHLSLVPLDMEPQPIILSYIDLNLQMLASKKVGQQE